jgi:hypothetical protein
MRPDGLQSPFDLARRSLRIASFEIDGLHNRKVVFHAMMQFLQENAVQFVGNFMLFGVNSGLRQKTAEVGVLGFELNLVITHRSVSHSCSADLHNSAKESKRECPEPPGEKRPLT